MKNIQEIFSFINKQLNEEQRKTINLFHHDLFEIGDEIRDCTRFPSAKKIGTGNLPKLGEELMDLISKIPWFEK